MSCNRENVCWKTRNGTWSIGFFDFWSTGGGDYEWDVEYDFDRFNWVSTGHSTAQEARDAWDGSNPGGGQCYSEPSSDTDHFDEMVKNYQAELANLSLSRNFRT